MDDAQFGFDIDFDDKTQTFLDWVAPERVESAVRAFLSKVAPEMEADAQWWKSPLSLQVLDAALTMFGDWEHFVASDNRELADGFVTFLGECCIRRRPGMTWTKEERSDAPLYTEFSPAVHFAETGLGETLVPLAKLLFKENYGPRMVDYLIQTAGKPA